METILVCGIELGTFSKELNFLSRDSALAGLAQQAALNYSILTNSLGPSLLAGPLQEGRHSESLDLGATFIFSAEVLR